MHWPRCCCRRIWPELLKEVWCSKKICMEACDYSRWNIAENYVHSSERRMTKNSGGQRDPVQTFWKSCWWLLPRGGKMGCPILERDILSRPVHQKDFCASLWNCINDVIVLVLLGKWFKNELALACHLDRKLSRFMNLNVVYELTYDAISTIHLTYGGRLFAQSLLSVTFLRI